MVELTQEALRARWNELTQIFEEKDAARNERWAIINSIVDGTYEGTLAEARALEESLREEIKALHAEIAPIETERAMIARALSGKTGTP